MNTLKIGALPFVTSMFVIAQVAIGQTSSPQPSGKPSDLKQVQPRPRPQKQRQQQPQQQVQRSQPAQQFQQQTQQEASASPSQQHEPKQQQQQHQRQARPVHRSTPPPTLMSFEAAQQRRQHEQHPRDWWTQHYPVIVLVGGGYYYFDSGYWFPAPGYDPNYEAYDYDGPIYTYGNLLPDQVILNVQHALTDLGYFTGVLSGSLSPATRSAISAYQQDNGLVVNGVVDAPLVYSLGLQ
jgi:putative peptidoglycan binding protein